MKLFDKILSLFYKPFTTKGCHHKYVLEKKSKTRSSNDGLFNYLFYRCKKCDSMKVIKKIL